MHEAQLQEILDDAAERLALGRYSNADAAVHELVAEVRRLTAALATVTAERDDARAALATVTAERDDARAALATARREGAESERARCVRIAKSYAGPFALMVSDVSKCALDIARDIDRDGGAT